VQIIYRVVKLYWHQAAGAMSVCCDNA